MNRTRAALVAFAAFAVIVAFVALPTGCTKVAPTTGGGGSGPDKAEDPWPAAVGELRKTTDPNTCRRVLNQLSADLTRGTVAPPPTLTEAAVKDLTTRMRLTDEEVKEVTGSAYTGLDAAYLAECLYLRDVARSFDATGQPPDRQAAAAFAWVCRQSYLRPWGVLEGGQRVFGPPAPPSFVLRRGYGTGLERAYTFLALVQQLGLDGCLVGPPGQEQTGVQKIVDGKLWKGPFWAVGVRGENDVFLFEPWRGIPFPGPGGKGVATLGQLKATPDLVKTWREDKSDPWNVPPADITGATVYVAVPLSAVTPRMALLETQFATGLGVKLTADPKEVLVRFAKGPAPAALWAPAAEPFAYQRVMATFLPKGAGGLHPVDLHLAERLVADLIPPLGNTRPPGLTTDVAAGLIADRAREEFGAALVGPGYLERIHRGQFHDVSRDLVAVDRRFAAAEERGRTANEAELIKEWVGKANEAYKKLTDARRTNNPSLELEAKEAEAHLWQAERRGAQAVVEQALAGAGRAETAFLLAVCKHEQAEKAQARLARAAAGAAKGYREQAEKAAADAWADAKDAWQRYTPYAARQDAGFPGRSDHARKLADRAAKLAAAPASDL